MATNRWFRAMRWCHELKSLNLGIKVVEEKWEGSSSSHIFFSFVSCVGIFITKGILNVWAWSFEEILFLYYSSEYVKFVLFGVNIKEFCFVEYKNVTNFKGNNCKRS